MCLKLAVFAVAYGGIGNESRSGGLHRGLVGFERDGVSSEEVKTSVVRLL